MSGRCCGTCVFWLNDRHCIRFPPVREAGGRAWPPTRRSDVCGEHTAAGEDARGFWRVTGTPRPDAEDAP